MRNTVTSTRSCRPQRLILRCWRTANPTIAEVSWASARKALLSKAHGFAGVGHDLPRCWREPDGITFRVGRGLYDQQPITPSTSASMSIPGHGLKAGIAVLTSVAGADRFDAGGASLAGGYVKLLPGSQAPRNHFQYPPFPPRRQGLGFGRKRFRFPLRLHILTVPISRGSRSDSNLPISEIQRPVTFQIT